MKADQEKRVAIRPSSQITLSPTSLIAAVVLLVIVIVLIAMS